MTIRTLEEIRRDRGENIHAFVLMVTGALPAHADSARQLCETIQSLVDRTLSDLEQATEGAMEITGLQLRMEKSEIYISEGLPNAR